MDKLINQLKKLSALVALIGAHHYGGQILDNLNQAEVLLKKEKDAQLNKTTNDIQELTKICKEISDNKNNMKIDQILSEEKYNTIRKSVESAQDCGSKVQEALNNSDINPYKDDMGSNITNMVKSLDEVSKILDEIKKGGHKLISSLNDFYQYLDSLSLLQESAFVHILLFFVLILTIINILAVFFGNVFIKYFDLENKFPSLAKFFKLRSMYQNYYLLWNILLLMIICLTGIGLNLLVLYAT